MRRLQSVPGFGLERTSTPEGLADYMDEITRLPHPIASRIVKLGPVELKFVFCRQHTEGFEWELEGEPFGEDVMPHVPPYWELVYNGAKEISSAITWDADYPERLDEAIQNSTRSELYRVGLQEALADATRDLRSAWKYRHYCLRRNFGGRLTGGDLSLAWRVLRKRTSEFLAAIRVLRNSLERHAEGPFVCEADRPAIEL